MKLSDTMFYKKGKKNRFFTVRLLKFNASVFLPVLFPTPWVSEEALRFILRFSSRKDKCFQV